MELLSVWAISTFLVLHVGAIACAWGTRVAAGSRFELAFQSMFLLALAGVGFTTWCSRSQDLGLGIPSGATLIVMILLAVSDFRRTHEPTAHRRSFALQS